MVKFYPDPGPTPDADLVEAIGRGDVSAFDELYGRYRDWVFRLAYRFTGEEHDAADVLQAAFQHFLEKTPRLEPHVKLTTFLYPAVKSLSLSMLRERGRRTPGNVRPDYMLGPAGTSSPESGKAGLAAVLTSLPEEQREVLLMHFVDLMSLEEIAEALGVPENTARARLRGAIAALRANPRTRVHFDE